VLVLVGDAPGQPVPVADDALSSHRRDNDQFRQAASYRARRGAGRPVEVWL
jgi:hypothetical protein